MIVGFHGDILIIPNNQCNELAAIVLTTLQNVCGWLRISSFRFQISGFKFQATRMD